MSAGGGDGDGAFDGFLAADIGEIEVGGELGGLIGVAVELVGFEGKLFVEEGDGLGEGGDGVDFDAFDDGGFAGVVGGEDDALESFLFGEEGEGEGAFDFADAAVEGEFAGDEEIFVAVGLDEIGAAQDADGHGEIEAWGVFFDVGGGEVDEEGVLGEGEAGVDDGAADAFDGFFDGGLGQTDDGGFLEAALGDVDFDLTELGVDADEDEGVDSGEQGAFIEWMGSSLAWSGPDGKPRSAGWFGFAGGRKSGISAWK